MSAKILGQVWDYILTPEEQIVLLAFADHADHNGEHAWPSIPLLTWKTGLSERTVYRVLNGERAQPARRGRKAAPAREGLVGRGVLIRTRKAVHHRPTEYRIVLGNLVRKLPFVSGVHRDDGAAPLAGGGETVRGDGAQLRDDGGHLRPATVVLNARQEPSVEPSFEPSEHFVSQKRNGVKFYDPGDPDETRRVTRAYEEARRRPTRRSA